MGHGFNSFLYVYQRVSTGAGVLSSTGGWLKLVAIMEDHPGAAGFGDHRRVSVVGFYSRGLVFPGFPQKMDGDFIDPGWYPKS